MKKIIALLAVLLFVSGCAARFEVKEPEVVVTDEKPGEVVEVVEKIDQDRPFVHSDTDGSFNLYDLTLNGGDKEQAEITRSLFIDNGLFPEFKFKDKIYPVENIYLNFKSEDKNIVDQFIQNEIEKAKIIQKENKDKVESGVPGYNWSSVLLADYNETDKYFSFSIYNYQAVIPSDAISIQVHNFTFDKTTGELIESDRILDEIGMDSDAVLTNVQEHLDSINSETLSIIETLTEEEFKYQWLPLIKLDGIDSKHDMNLFSDVVQLDYRQVIEHQIMFNSPYKLKDDKLVVLLKTTEGMIPGSPYSLIHLK